MKMNILKAVFFLTASFVIYITNPTLTLAGGQNGCVPVYGGGVQCPKVGQILINKTVLNPSTNIFVDNLSLSDPKYHPGNTIKFRLIVKNTSVDAMDKISVTDIFPDFVDFTSGPGTFEGKTKTLTFDVLNMSGGEERSFEILGKIVHVAALPADKSVVCLLNRVEAFSSSQKDSDTSQFCIEKELKAPEVPAAGPEHWILSLAGLGTALTIGLYLRKRTVIG